MDAIIDTFRGAFTDLLVTAATGLMAIMAAYAIYFIRKTQLAIAAKAKSSILLDVTERVTAIAETVVWSFEARVARELREAVKDGRADREELIAIGRRAVEDVLAHLGKEGEKALREAVGSVEDYVRDLVEAEVERMKRKIMEGAG